VHPNAVTPSHHVAMNFRDGAGRSVRLIVTEGGILREFLDYWEAPSNCGYSLSWWRKAVQAIGLLVDHRAATQAATGLPAPWGPHYLQTLKMHLRHGTFVEVDKVLACPLGLHWQGRGERAVWEAMSHITRFGDFCTERYGWPWLNPYAMLPVPGRTWRRTGPDGAFPRGDAGRGRLDNERVVPIRIGGGGPAYGDPPAFPAGRLADLPGAFLRRGAREGQPRETRLHLRDMMIAVLQGAAGLRCSEPFHIYVGDVEEDPTQPGVARVRVHDPVDSAVPCPGPGGTWHPVRRADFLQGQSYVPRNQTHGGTRAGWKSPIVKQDGRYRYFEVQWYPIRYGVLFLDLYREYTARGGARSSPYLFLNDAGSPYTIRQYEKKLKLACLRVGVEPTKAAGGTTHGLRHHYAQGLKAAGLSESAIAACLNQSDERSAETYTRPFMADVARQLRDVDPLTANVVIPGLSSRSAHAPRARAGETR